MTFAVPCQVLGGSTRRRPSVDAWTTIDGRGAVHVELHVYAYVAGVDLEVLVASP